MTSLVVGPLLVGGLGPRPPGPSLKSGPARDVQCTDKLCATSVALPRTGLYAALQHVYRSTVVARLTYAATAWRGFIKASDRQRINSVMDRVRRLGYCSSDIYTNF